MKNKKGLGSIPKSLAWIDSTEEIITQPIVEKREKKQQQKTSKLEEVEIHKAKASSLEKKSNTEEIHSPVLDSTTSLKGLPEGWTRATFIIKQELNEKLKALAYWDRVTVKEVVHEALSCYLQDKNVRAMPKKKEIV